MHEKFGKYVTFSDLREILEARARIELANKGFADLCLTTWLPRPFQRILQDWTNSEEQAPLTANPRAQARVSRNHWSGRRDLNPRLRPWQGRTLPLSYSRSTVLS